MKPPENVGVAIELKSHPAGVRGLKHMLRIRLAIWRLVAPRRGAWIETEWQYPKTKRKQ